VRRGCTTANASRLERACTPQPMNARWVASRRARYFAATAVAAPVRTAVIQDASITASGTPVAGSFKIIRPEM